MTNQSLLVNKRAKNRYHILIFIDILKTAVKVKVLKYENYIWQY